MTRSKRPEITGAEEWWRQKEMQLVAVLFAIFAVAFVASIGWYTGRGVVRFVAGTVAHARTKLAAPNVEHPGRGEKNSFGVLE
jgi:hypothetical protein